MSFRGFAHADVANGRGDQRAFGALQRAEHDLDGELRPVLASPGKLDARSNLLGQRVGGAACAVGDQSFGKTFGNDVDDFLAHKFIAAIAELFLCLHVQKDDFSGLVHDYHGVRCRLKQPAIFRPGLFAVRGVDSEPAKHPAALNEPRRDSGEH